MIGYNPGKRPAQAKTLEGGLSLSSEFEVRYPISQKMLRHAGESIKKYAMIESGDRIMIGLSGGKDSLLLSLVLATLHRKSPVKFKLTACLVDQSDGQMDLAGVTTYMATLDIPLKIINHPTYKIMEIRDERSPCSLCANLRRGILANAALESDCNVLALGHHKDDAVETVLLNLFYGGRFKCYHPHLFMSRSKIRVIRPLIYTEEQKITIEAQRLGLPVTSSCCPYGDDSKRKMTKEILAQIEAQIPEIKSNMIHALENAILCETWAEQEIKE